MPSFEETNNPGYDDVFNNQSADETKTEKPEQNNIEDGRPVSPSYEEINNPGYDDVFNIRKRKF